MIWSYKSKDGYWVECDATVAARMFALGREVKFIGA